MTVKHRPMDIPGRFTKVSSLRKRQKILSGERQQPLVEMGQKGEETVQPDEDTAVAYVDGSYNVATGEYSCGVVFLYEGKEETMAQKGEDEELGADAERGWRDPGIAACDGTCCQTGDSEDKNLS